MKYKEFIKRILRNWSVKIGSLAAAVILFYINRINTMDQHELEVAIRVSIPPDYAVAEPYLEKVKLDIRGQKPQNIQELSPDDFVVYADLTVEKSFTMGEQVLLVYEKRGKALEAGPLDITLYPPTVTIRLEKRLDKVVKVKKNWVGELPEGYTWVTHQINPEKVVITGPASRVDKIDSLVTEQLDISGKKGEFYIRLSLIIPDELVTLKDLSNVGFTGLVTELLFSKTIGEVALEGINLRENLIIVKSLEPGKMEIKASGYILKNLRTDLLRMVVDCSNIDRAGKYMLKTAPELPEGVFLVSHEPKEVLVDFNTLPDEAER